MKHPSRERAGRQAHMNNPRGGATKGLTRACPDCDAPAGHRCRFWKMDAGQRIYVIREMVGIHPARRSSPAAPD